MKRQILARWFSDVVNFGDLITPFLIEKIAGGTPVNTIRSRFNRHKVLQRLRPRPEPEQVWAGSILGWGDWRDGCAVIWGAGFMFPESALRFRPRRIHCVRGALTRDLIPREWRGRDLPLGDPGLLIPDFISPTRSKAGRGVIGVLPHYSHLGSPVIREIEKTEEFRIIDPQRSIDLVVDDVVNCDVVISSSLHGLIVSDAFGVANTWIRIGELPSGGAFKFHDYFSTTEFSQSEPVPIIQVSDVRVAARLATVRDTRAPKAALRSSCPFAYPAGSLSQEVAGEKACDG